MNESYKGAFGAHPTTPPQDVAATEPEENVAYLGDLETVMLKQIHSSLDGSPDAADISKAREMLQLMIDSGGRC